MNSSEKNIKILNQTFRLHPSGAMYWQEKAMLLIADVHLGKVAHFRKHGAAVPIEAGYKNLEKLTEVVNHYNPKTVCFLGDLFHSKLNSDWEDFVKWVEYTTPNIILISGNHDIIPNYLFEEIKIQVLDTLEMDGFLLTHHPVEENAKFNFCGHLHPGIKLQGVGRQNMRLPCFFKRKQQLILPAFGTFTGKHILKPQDDDEVYVLVEGEILEVK